MKQEWIIEEELIEWLDRNGDVSECGREIRLINPKGEIVGRRLVVRRKSAEYYLLFHDNRCYTWFYPFYKPAVFVAQITAEIQRFWMGRSLMTYRQDADGNMYGHVIWKLLERDLASELKFCSHYQCSRRMVEKYKYLPRIRDSVVVEWRVCFDQAPSLFGKEVPLCSELWWGGQLKRRHTLLHYRAATAEERAFFRIPRNAKIYREEIEQLFSPLIEYVPLLLSEY